jgi:hypothetical protein
MDQTHEHTNGRSSLQKIKKMDHIEGKERNDQGERKTEKKNRKPKCIYNKIINSIVQVITQINTTIIPKTQTFLMVWHSTIEYGQNETHSTEWSLPQHSAGILPSEIQRSVFFVVAFEPVLG